MKKVVPLFSIFALIIFSSFIIAQEVCEDGDNTCKINNGYLCLNEKIDNRGCSSLSSEEKVFSALATGDCKNDLTSDSKFKSDLKYTAQVVLALGGNTEGEEWLLSQEMAPSEINWFLQIESTEATTCTITYNNKDYDVSIGEDKRISSNAGTCLTLSTGNYWLEINSACYDEIFEVSCDQSFLTSLIYQKQNSDTIYVSEDTHSTSASGTTSEQVNSSCFKQGNSCNYEGSLWAATILDSPKFGYDISSYMPYLITLAEEDENQKFLPEAFLYLLTDDFFSELLQKQKSGKWWAQSNDKFYDTALALYALQYDEPSEKEDSINWLLNEAQDNDGCWNNGNIRNTAFILYSINPRPTTTGGGVDCESAGNFCMSSISCSEIGGEVIKGQSCSGSFACCNKDKVIETCEEQLGDICNSNQNCIGGIEPQASDLGVGEVCCVGGSCQVPSVDLSACELAGGECRVSGCFDDEQESFESCDFTSNTCCISKQPGGINVFWIVFLAFLIVLVVVGIIYKDKLRKLLFRFKNKFMPLRGGAKPGPSGPGGRRPPFPPLSPAMRRRPVPRRVIPTPIRTSTHRIASRIKPRKEFDDVLKKLKDMGK